MTPGEEEAALLALPAEQPDRTRHYGPHPSQVIDFYLPEGGEAAAVRRVTMLHGGFWRQAYDRRHLSATAAELARRHGMAVALVEYRRVGGDGGWPGTFDDAAQAVDTAWAGASGGGVPVLLGHSAGGQLALWAAHRHRLPERSRWRTARPQPCAVVAVAPVADLAYGHELGLSGGAVAELLGVGGGAAGPEERFAEADPMRLLPSVVPVTVLHGTADPDVPVEVSRRYAAASGAELVVLPGTGHYGPLIPGSGTFSELLAALLR